MENLCFAYICTNILKICVRKKQFGLLKTAQKQYEKYNSNTTAISLLCKSTQCLCTTSIYIYVLIIILFTIIHLVVIN